MAKFEWCRIFKDRYKDLVVGGESLMTEAFDETIESAALSFDFPVVKKQDQIGGERKILVQFSTQGCSSNTMLL
jgi:hypothetical protein